MVLEDENGIDRIDCRWHDAVVVPHNLVAVHEISHARVGQLARKQGRMDGRTVGVRFLEILNRELLSVSRQINGRKQVA